MTWPTNHSPPLGNSFRSVVLLIVVSFGLLQCGCSRIVAPPLPHDADNVQNLRDELNDFDW